MKKSKSSEAHQRDRLSELPDSLILQILSLLPMRDVVRTTFLSKRWKDLWTTVPCLIFEGDIELYADKFRNFVNRVMIHWKGAKILRFHLDFEVSRCYASDVDSWLHFALDKGVEELCVNVVDAFEESEFFPPQRLYSCSSIRKLVLWGCNSEVRGDLQWNQLKSLTIDAVLLSDHVINKVLCGAPQLEELILGFIESSDLDIRSSSLKTLKIEKKDANAVDIDNLVLGDICSTLRIWTPNVETLEISGDLYVMYVLMNVSSLTSASVGYYLQGYVENGNSYAYKSLEVMLGQVFRSAGHIYKVALSDWCSKVLGEMKKKHMLAPLSDVKFLKLHARQDSEIVGILEIFPKLTMLVLKHSSLARNYEEFHFFEILCRISEPYVFNYDVEDSKSKANFSKSYLLHLRTVEITWIPCDNSIFPTVEFLLKYASKLEMLVFRLKGIGSLVPPQSLTFAEQKLQSLPKSSPNAEMIVCKD